MKKIATLICLLLSGLKLFAQADSLAVVNAKWSVNQLAPKVSWKSVRFVNKDLFGANENINYIELSKGFKHMQLIVAHSDSLETTSQHALKWNALAGINGSFFQMRGADPDNRLDLKGVPKLERSKLDHNRSQDYIRENNRLIAKNVKGKNASRQRSQQGTVAITDSHLAILQPDTLNLNWEDSIKAKHIMTSGPLLLLKGENLSVCGDSFCIKRHPRTAVGVKGDGTILLFVVDGRFTESEGMSLSELQKTMRWLGCKDAINLDGGGSTTMYIKDQPDNGVVNYPSDNKKFDHAGEREVANAILLIPQR